MRLNLLLACAFVAGVIGVSVFAQSDDGLFPETEKNFPAESFEQDEALDAAPSADDEKLDASEEQKLRQQYLELIEQKSVHMDRSALREAISRAEKDIDELKADAKLQEAKQLLLDLVKTHPSTDAAQAARAMLHVQTIREPTPSDEIWPAEGATFKRDQPNSEGEPTPFGLDSF